MENIIVKSLGKVMKPRYKTYALSVISDRALPDIKTGLKPVLKRSLFAMGDLGLKSKTPHKKSARVVGEVLGKYHPHGDASVYEALVRTSQNWCMRYPLTDMHGNNGSIDGDGAAAMRYTGIRLTKVGEAILADINKNTVDFLPNFDDSEMEPITLPCMLPILLANGVEGIAVSMATTIPPHNMRELMSAAERVINNTIEGKETSLAEIMEDVKGPDFPDGGIIINNKELAKAFSTGKGKVTLRGEVEVIDSKKGHKTIKITKFPYGVKPIDFIAKVTKLSQENKIEGIREVENGSEGDEVEVNILLKKDVNAELVLNQLYKQTDLQKNISYNMNALVDGKPVQVTLPEYLNEYLSHCLDIIIRRTTFERQKDRKRISNIEALSVAVENLTEVTRIVTQSDTPVEELMSFLEIDEDQANHILETKLRTLGKQNTIKLEEEYNSLLEKVAEYDKILTDESYSLEVLAKEIAVLKEEFGDDRRTQINTSIDGEITDEDLIKDEPLVVTITSDGLIKSVDEKEYSTQKRGGKGSKAAATKDDEIVTDLFSINAKDDILFITNIGKCHKIKGYQIPKVAKTAKGKHVNNFIKLEEDEDIVSVMALRVKDEAESSILFVTALGQIKRLAVKDLSARSTAVRVLTIKEGDALQTCLKVKEGEDVLIATAKGQSIRFTVSTTTKKPVRPQGRAAAGVQGIRVAEDDYVIGATVVDDNSNILTLTAQGLSKQTKGAAWEAKGRGGKGIVCHKITEKTGDLVSVLAVKTDDELFVGTESGKIIRLEASSIATSGRAAIGSKAITLGDGDFAFTASLAPVSLEEEEEGSED